MGAADGGGSGRFNHELLFSCSFHESSRYALHENPHTDSHQQTGGDACGKFYWIIADVLRRDLCNGAAQQARQYHRQQETQPHQGGGTDIMTIQDLPGHKYLKTSMTLRFRLAGCRRGRKSVSIAGLDCQIQAKTRLKLAGNCQIWQSGKA